MTTLAGMRILTPLHLAALVFAAGSSSASPAQTLPDFGCGAHAAMRELRVEGTAHQGGMDSKYGLTLDLNGGRYVTSFDFGLFTEAYESKKTGLCFGSFLA